MASDRHTLDNKQTKNVRVSRQMALPQRKISQAKATSKRTTFFLTNQEKEGDKTEELRQDDKSGASSKPKFNSVAKKVMMVNRAFLPVQRKISRSNSGSQSDGIGGRYGAHIASAPSESEESSRYNGRDPTPKENTYKMEPDGQFLPEKTKNIMQKILKSQLDGKKFSSAESKNLSVLLSDEIKGAVRENAMLERYKLVCVVYIGQLLGQGVHITSRCLWNTNFDAFSSATFQNDDLFAQASIFAVYVE